MSTTLSPAVIHRQEIFSRLSREEEQAATRYLVGLLAKKHTDEEEMLLTERAAEMAKMEGAVEV